MLRGDLGELRICHYSRSAHEIEAEENMRLPY
jgi:hypothetical protein